MRQQLIQIPKEQKHIRLVRIVLIKITLFYHNDHLGSTSAVTNESGDVVQETFYEPFGSIISGGELTMFDYEGKEFSELTGDYDFRFRKYDSSLGIFTQPDAGIQNIYDPQALNRYAFERNNPYLYVDENGRVAQVALAILGIGVLSGIIASNYYLISSAINDEDPTLRGYGTYFAGGFFAGTIGAGTAAIAFSAGSLGIAGAGAVGLLGTIVGTSNSQVFTNIATGKSPSDNLISSNVAGLLARGSASTLPAGQAGSSRFFLNNIIENYVGGFINTVYNLFTGGSSQNSQQINSAQRVTSSTGGSGGSSNTINIGSSSNGGSSSGGKGSQSSSGGGVTGFVKNVAKSVGNFFRRLF